MKKIFALLAFLSIQAMGITNVTLPYLVDTASIPKVKYIDKNDSALKWGVNNLGDTVNAALGTGKLIRSISPTIAGAPVFSGLTASLPMFTDGSKAATSNAMTGTGSVVMSASPTLTGTLTGAAANFSGAVSTGALSATTGALSSTLNVADRLAFTGNGTLTTASIARTAASGLVLRGLSGSSYEMDVQTGGGVSVMRIPSGANAVAFPNVDGVDITTLRLTSLTLGSVPYLSTSGLVAQNNAQFYWDNTNKSLMVGDNANQGLLLASTGDFQARGTSSIGPKFRAQAVGLQGYFVGDRVNGTFATPTALANNDIIVSFLGLGYHGIGAAGTHSSEMRFIANESWTATNRGSRIEWYTNNNGSTVQSLGLSLGAAGNNNLVVYGPATLSSTATTTGVHTFTAAPVFSSVTASQILSVDGSKSLTSTATTGSGSVVLATSPTIASPTFTGTSTFGALAATTIALGGNEAFDYDEGTFTATATGLTTSPTGTVSYVRVGKAVTLILPALSGTSNATTFTYTGLPPGIRPATTQSCAVNEAQLSGGLVNGVTVQIAASGTLTFRFAASATGWADTGTKGLPVAQTISYTLQ